MTDTSHNENSDSTPDRLENANQTLKVILQCENEKNLLLYLFLTENPVIQIKHNVEITEIHSNNFRTTISLKIQTCPA